MLLTLTALGGVAGASLVPPLLRRLGDARTLVLFTVASTLVVLGITAGNVVSASFRQRWAEPGMLSRVMTSIQVVNLGTFPLGAVAAGGLAS